MAAFTYTDYIPTTGQTDYPTNISDCFTQLTTDIAVLDGMTSSTAQLNYLSGVSAGTALASKALVLNSSSQITSGLQVLIADTSIIAPLVSATSQLWLGGVQQLLKAPQE